MADTLDTSHAELLQTYVGRTVRSLPTPSCLLHRKKVKKNCDAMLAMVDRLGVAFRPHIKTHKTLQGVRLQLGDSRHGRVVVSTLKEAYALLPLVREGIISDVLYGVPFSPSKIPALHALREQIPHLRLMMDCEDQLNALMAYQKTHGLREPWSVFIKVDCGYGRAGLPCDSDALNSLIRQTLAGPARECVALYGFYSHAGQSYHDTALDAAKETLLTEIAAANGAAKFALTVLSPLQDQHKPRYVMSVGATPTAHAAHALDMQALPELSGELELHAGCYAVCDLQQYATSLVPYEDIAIRVVAEVVSRYGERDELLMDAGCLALSREVGPVPGYGNISDPDTARAWRVGRMSQEHGILTREDKGNGEGMPSVGQKVLIVPQHACITGAGHAWYCIVDEEGLDAKVVDVWMRFNGW